MKRTLLKRKTPLKARKGLNPVSDKQRVKNALWNKITDERAEEEGYICQWCHSIGQRLSPSLSYYLDGHHILKRRYNIHTRENCYVCHRFGCHGEIEDKNIDVRECPDRESWEHRGDWSTTDG